MCLNKKLALFLPSCIMDQVKVCLHFLFWFSKIFWMESNRLFQVRKYLHIHICYVQCTYYEKRTFLHIARPVGTFLVCRRKLSELSSKVQIVWEGLKIWKKSPTYFWNDLLSKVKTKWEIFSTFYQNIWTLFKNVCSSQRDEIFSEVVLLFSCISIRGHFYIT